MDRATVSSDATGYRPGWLGANFWSRRGGPFMWRDYDGPTISEELAVLRDHGLNITRSFLFWPDFHPEPDAIDEQMMGHLVDFLDRHTAVGMQSIPTFIVGHMSGENWDPSWRNDRDLYADVWMVGRQAWFAQQVVRRLIGHPAVAGYLLSNEMPIYGRPPHEPAPAAPAEQVTTWVQIMVDAIRAAGATVPVSTGDGAWGIEITGVDNGFPVRQIAPLVDFIGPHVYRMETDLVRQHLSPAFACHLAGFTGRPVVLEEFGVSTAFVSDENAGHYYRQVLHTSLLAGATGWLAWNNTDYDELAGQDPYRHHAFEMYFGITDRSGTPKAPLRELAAFGRVLDAIDLPGCSVPPAEVQLLVSSFVEVGYPFTQPEDHLAPIESLRQAYVSARGSDLPIGFAREVDGIDDGVPLLIAPSVKQLTAPTWARLGDLAAAGSTVYVSYSAGNHDVQRGPWYADLNGLFGVRHRLIYGLADPIPAQGFSFTFQQDFGGIAAGTVWAFEIDGPAAARVFLPVDAVDATVIAVDDRGNPALLVRETGAGRLVFCTYPLEYLAAQTRSVNPDPSCALYAALAAVAGVLPEVTVADPVVMVAGLRHTSGRRFVWLISQSAEPLTVTPSVSDRGRLIPLGGGTPLHTIDLAPYGVRVVEVAAATGLPQ